MTLQHIVIQYLMNITPVGNYLVDPYFILFLVLEPYVHYVTVGRKAC